MDFINHDLRLALIEVDPTSGQKIVPCSFCEQLMAIGKDMESGRCWKCVAAKMHFPPIANQPMPQPKASHSTYVAPRCKICGKEMHKYIGGRKCTDEVLEKGLHAPTPKKIPY